MMGPSHSLSGLAVGLAGVAIYNSNVPTASQIDPVVAIMGIIITAGAALAPDIDSHSATAVRSFGVFGELAHKLVNGLSVGLHSATRTKYDSKTTDGHRTLFHTIIMALVAGVVTTLLCLPTWPITLWGHEATFGQLMAIILMAIYLNLMLAGIFDKVIKNVRRKYGPYILMAFSLITTLVVSFFLPASGETSGISTYAWLGIAVALGNLTHLAGDAITKAGIPAFWPLKIRGKRWYDVALPSFMRISAGGTLEYALIVPLLTIATVGLLVWNIFIYISYFNA